jgi:DNA-binding HxlR family transcriptional regulator
MSRKDDNRRSACPISFALDILGDKWTLLVIRDLVFMRKRHFRDFLASPENIASNILASRLKRLEARGVVSRRPDPASARKVIYELTAKGADLVPVLLELIRWGAKYDPKTAAPASFTRRITEDREGLIAEICASLKRKVESERRGEQA